MNQVPLQPISFPRAPEKILIIKPSALGDIIHTLPFLAATRATFPKAEIHWVVAKGLHTLLEEHPLINRLWLLDKDRWKQLSRLRETIPEINKFRKELGEERFDVSIDLSGLLRSGLITLAANARYKLGFSDSDEGSPLFYTHKIEGGKQIHAVERYLKLAAMMGCDTSTVNFPMPPYPKDSLLLASLPEHFCVMAPSAGKEANRWPADRFGKLAASLPLPSIIISNKADSGIGAETVANSNNKAINLAGKTSLKELVSLISRARFLVTNDTGPMHIAAALNIPVFAIFGPANPVRTGPYGTIHTVIQEQKNCIPCYRRKPCAHWSCMKNISVERVRQTIYNNIALYK
ncbi:MAG: glycosyltransferase family 9 protein [Deltaproteobacteria bacterium]|nr:glycosyltransferase family 9 protein [Deltaproteobacteria bacterium]